jgi:hypothetical protein
MIKITAALQHSIINLHCNNILLYKYFYNLVC